MSCLYIVRHGIAIEHGTPGYDEVERPLTPLGERRMRQVAKGLKTLKPKLDRIITSPLPRASKTAKIVAEVLGMEEILETADELRAGESAESIRHWLTTRDETNLMIVGHNPSLQDLISLLSGGSITLELSQRRRRLPVQTARREIQPRLAGEAEVVERNALNGRRRHSPPDPRNREPRPVRTRLKDDLSKINASQSNRPQPVGRGDRLMQRHGTVGVGAAVAEVGGNGAMPRGGNGRQGRM